MKLILWRLGYFCTAHMWENDRGRIVYLQLQRCLTERDILTMRSHSYQDMLPTFLVPPVQLFWECSSSHDWSHDCRVRCFVLFKDVLSRRLGTGFYYRVFRPQKQEQGSDCLLGSLPPRPLLMFILGLTFPLKMLPSQEQWHGSMHPTWWALALGALGTYIFCVSEHKGMNYPAQTQVTLRKVLSHEGPHCCPQHSAIMGAGSQGWSCDR